MPLAKKRIPFIVTLVVLVVGIFGLRNYLLHTASRPGAYVPYHPADPQIARDLEASIAAIVEGRATPADSAYNTFYASLYDALFVEGRQSFVLERIFLHLGRPAGSQNLRVLDAGCGTGNEFRILNRHYRMTGIDRSEAMIRVAALKSTEGDFVVGDFQDPSAFAPGTFDAVISLYSPIFYNPDYTVVLRNFHRWLAEDGYVIIDVLDSEGFDDPAFWASTDRNVSFGEHLLEYRGSAVVEGQHVFYEERFVIDGSHSYEQTHHMVYPTHMQFERAAADIGFVIQAVHDLSAIGDIGEKLYVLRSRGHLAGNPASGAQ